ncbi:MAG: ParB N-terminal domain-containing protein [Patescibacteria group bacterium]|nr:ParB N-terminal domain-containing protein [Patescibacteria group bacterium]
MPDQVIKDWLLPFAKEKGWPPKHETLGPILMYKSIDWWNKIKWKKQKVLFDEIKLSTLYKNNIINMVNYYKNKEDGQTKNGYQRIINIIKYIKKYNSLPKPVILITTKNGYDILDGNHRLTACTILQEENVINKFVINTFIGKPQKITEKNFQEDSFYWDK